MLKIAKSPLNGGASVIALSIAFSGLSGTAFAHALPGHGRFADGRGSISKSGGRMTVDQSSQTGIIDWKSFSVGKNNSVVFDNGHGATLNEVMGGNLSRIAGSLHATGSLYLINPAGVAVLPTGRVVTTGSFIASSRNADEDAFSSGNKRLLLSGRAKGNVVNRGAIDSANGRVGLFGRNVTDEGTISARNASLIARGTTRVSGQIAAHSREGHGGNIETSGNRLALSGAMITGHNWLLDPKNLKVTSAAASTIDSSLNGGTNVTLKTTATSASGPGTKSSGPGDIIINSALSWSGTARLTLDAYHSVVVQSAIHAMGKGALVVKTDDGGSSGDLMFGSKGYVAFDKVKSHLKINGTAYTLVSTLGELARGIVANPGGDFALVNNLNIGGYTYTYVPIPTTFTGTFEGLGHTISNFSIDDNVDSNVGLFAELGTGGTLRDIGVIKANVIGLHEQGFVGVLVGTIEVSGTAIIDAHASGTVAGGYGCSCGGLVGYDVGTIRNSYATDMISAGAGSHVGGLVGFSFGSVVNSHASGAVNTGDGGAAGGLIGQNYGTITASYGSGQVFGETATNGVNSVTAGGLVGINRGGITTSYATGDVIAYGARVGGLAGFNSGSINNSYALGDVTGAQGSDVGGLVGLDDNGGTISDSYSTGEVFGDASGNEFLGGLVGNDNGGTYTDDYWDTSTSGIANLANGVGNVANAPGVEGLTTTQLSAGLPSGFSSSVWKHTAGINGGLPYLINNPPP